MAAMRYALVLLMLLALPAQAVELYRCTVKGKTIYQDAPCKDGGKVIDTDAREPIRGYDTDTVDGRSLYILRTVPRGTAQNYAAPAPSYAPENTQQIAEQQECAELKSRADLLRSQARQPQSASTQDYLRNQLRGVEERMFALRCG